MSEKLTLVADDLLLKIRAENDRHRNEILKLETMLGLATKGVAVGATLTYEDGGTLLIQSIDIEKQSVTGVYTETRTIPFNDIATAWSKIDG